MTWNRVSRNQLAAVLAVLTRLEWPITAEDLPSRLEELSWIPVVPGLLAFHTGLGVSPGVATASKVAGEAREIGVDLVDSAEPTEAGRTEFLAEAFAHLRDDMVDILGEQHDEHRTGSSVDEVVWSLASGATVSLIRSLRGLSLRVESPRQAHVRRVLIRMEDEEASSTPLDDE